MIYLRCCVGVSRSGSSRKGLTVALYAKTQTVVLVVEEQGEQEAWYLAIKKLMDEEHGAGFDEDDDGYCTLPPAAFFKEVQIFNVLNHYYYPKVYYLPICSRAILIKCISGSSFTSIKGLARRGEAPGFGLYQVPGGGESSLPHSFVAHPGQSGCRQRLAVCHYSSAECSPLWPLGRFLLPGAGQVGAQRSWRDLDGSKRAR